MSNDYTLPPVPAHPDWQVDQCNWLERERDAIASYGHAVAAPLLAQIAELESRVSTLQASTCAAADLLIEVRGERDRLRAEVEALKEALKEASESLGHMGAEHLKSRVDAALRAAGEEP